MVQQEASVHSPSHCLESMSNAQEPSLQHRLNRRSRTCVDVLTLVLSRELAMTQRRSCSRPVEPTHVRTMRWLNRWSSRHLYGYLRAQRDRLNRQLSTRRTEAYAEKCPTVTNGNFKFVGYIYGIPGHLKLAGVARSHTHTQEHLQAIKELSNQIFSP